MSQEEPDASAALAAAAAGGQPWPAGSKAHWPAELAAPATSSAPYLQVALDLCDVPGACALLDATAAAGEPLPELLEVGTPVRRCREQTVEQSSRPAAAGAIAAAQCVGPACGRAAAAAAAGDGVLTQRGGSRLARHRS